MNTEQTENKLGSAHSDDETKQIEPAAALNEQPSSAVKKAEDYFSEMDEDEMEKLELEFSMCERLSNGEITPKNLDRLTGDEQKALNSSMMRPLEDYKYEKYDECYEEIKPLLDEENKQAIWEYNHSKIVAFITNHITKNGIMPTKSRIAHETGLTRVTVNRHLEEYRHDDKGKERRERFVFAEDVLLAALFKKALTGDTGAMKLLYEITGLHSPKNKAYHPVIQNQHNYIQINGLKLSQEELAKLEPQKLRRVESIIRKMLPLSTDKPE